MDIIRYGNKKLKELSSKIEIFDNKLKQLADEMHTIMIETNGIGLAGPQIGINKRIIVVDTQEEDDIGKLYLINPKIIGYSVKKSIMEEGCLSIPNILAPVERSTIVKVKANDIEGNTITMTAKNLLARVIQHEVDHLNGILFIDRLNEEIFDKISSTLLKIKRGEEYESMHIDINGEIVEGKYQKNRKTKKVERIEI